MCVRVSLCVCVCVCVRARVYSEWYDMDWMRAWLWGDVKEREEKEREERCSSAICRILCYEAVSILCYEALSKHTVL